MDSSPQSSVSPTFINTYGLWSIGADARAVQSLVTPASVTWPSANLAVYYPLVLPWSYTVRRAFWTNGSGTLANADIGIYDIAGARIWSAGHDNSDAAVAQVGNSAVQYVTPSTVFTLSPGRYFLAVSFSGTTNVAYGAIPGSNVVNRLTGMQQQASSVPLPSPAVFAAASNAAVSLAGITKTSS